MWGGEKGFSRFSGNEGEEKELRMLFSVEIRMSSRTE